MKTGRPAWIDVLQGALASPVSEGELMASLALAAASGATRQHMYDTLLGLLEARRSGTEEVPEQDEALIEDVLDRLWGYCPKSRLLFPELPVLPNA